MTESTPSPVLIPPRGTHSVPPRAHPLARELYRRMGERRVTYRQLEAASGVKQSCFKAWRTSNAPGTNSIQAALNAVGLQALPVPRANVLPDGLLADLQAVGTRHGVPLPLAELVAVAAERRAAA